MNFFENYQLLLIVVRTYGLNYTPIVQSYRVINVIYVLKYFCVSETRTDVHNHNIVWFNYYIKKRKMKVHDCNLN